MNLRLAEGEHRPIAIRVVIMSRSRQRSITTHRLFPAATLVVPESEIASYAHIPLEKVGIPDAISGVSAVRNWIVAHFPEECLLMMDDDISAAMCMVALKVASELDLIPEHAYDFALIDCPPNFNIITKNAIIASDLILVPAKPDYLSTLGIDYRRPKGNHLRSWQHPDRQEKERT